jgi:hypothetical protein
VFPAEQRCVESLGRRLIRSGEFHPAKSAGKMLVHAGHNGSIRDSRLVEIHHLHHLSEKDRRALFNDFNALRHAGNGTKVALRGRGG